jgi:predicted DNA-binding transcriptional regulator AlpA
MNDVLVLPPRLMKGGPQMRHIKPLEQETTPQPMPDGPLLLTRQQVSALTGLGIRTIDRLTARGILKRLRPAGMRCSRWRRADIEEWVADGCKQYGR